MFNLQIVNDMEGFDATKGGFNATILPEGSGGGGGTGRDGHSPYIGDNGNWFEWDDATQQFVDTGTEAQGPQGEQGEQGAQGPAGPQGESGEDGQDGADAVNPFKGWYSTLAELKAAHTATEGDSAYVKDASPATTWSIYVYDATATTDNNWADSGTDADTSSVQTFAFEYNDNDDTYDNLFTVGNEEYKVGSHRHLNKISTCFDGANGTYVRGNKIFGLIPERVYQFRIKNTSVPVTHISPNQTRFTICVYIDGSAQSLYEVKYTTVPSSDILLFIPKNAESVYIGGRCDAGYKMECDIVEYQSDRIQALFGYEDGVYGTVTSGSFNYKADKGYGLGAYIPVSKGDTVLWNYGDVTLRTMCLCVYDTNGNYITYYNNTTANQRTITNFMSSSELDSFLIRASLKIDCAKDSYLEVNGVRVWSGFNDNLGRVLNGMEQFLDERTFVWNAIDLNAYLLNGKCIIEQEGEYVWTDYGAVYMVPVVEGDIVRFKAVNNIPAYVNMLSDNSTETVNNVGDIIRYTDSVNWYVLEVPAGVSYLCINKKFDTVYDHTPAATEKKYYFANAVKDIEALKRVSVIYVDKMRTRTFNSSYNEEDTEAVRLKFSGLIRGKGTIETFLFFTDPHLNDYSRYEGVQIEGSSYFHITEEIRDKYISVLQKYYNSLPLDYCICGGDWTNYNKSYNEACEALGYPDAYMRKLFRNYYPVMGNHDNNPYNWGGGLFKLSQNDVNRLMFRENGNDYYSFDGLNTKFYVLNTGDSFALTMTTYRWEQVAWFANKLLTDNPGHAIILSHILSNGRLEGANSTYPTWRNGVHQMAGHLIDVAVAFNNKESITKNGITYDFSGATGRVEGYWVGHSHADMIDTAYEIPVVVTTDLEGGGYSDRVNYQNHSYSLIPTFDNCLVDYDNHRFHLVRVGSGVNRTVNTVPKEISVGGTIELIPVISGSSFTWVVESRDPNTTETLPTIITVSNGVVTGVGSGITGVRAINESGEEEYWIIKVE